MTTFRNSPYVQTPVDHGKSIRFAKVDSQDISLRLQALVGIRTAKELVSKALTEDPGQYDGIDWIKTHENLEKTLAQVQALSEIKDKDFPRYCIIQNFAHYDQFGYDNKDQILEELEQRIGMTAEQVKEQYTYLWS